MLVGIPLEKYISATVILVQVVYWKFQETPESCGWVRVTQGKEGNHQRAVL